MKKIIISFVIVATLINGIFPAGFAAAAFDFGSYGDTGFGNTASFGTPSFSGSTNNSNYTDPAFGGSANTASFGTVGFTGTTASPTYGNTGFSGGTSFGTATFGNPSFGGNTNTNTGYGTVSFGDSTGNTSFGTPSFGDVSFGGSTGATATFGNPTFGNGTGGTTATFGNPSFGTGVGTGAVAFGEPSFGTGTGTGTGVAFGIPAFGPPVYTPPTYNPPVYEPPTYLPPFYPPVTNSAPSISTQPATGVSNTSAILNASVNPMGSATTYWFEYGTSYNLGSRTSTQSAGSSNREFGVAANIYGLAANTTYYFRGVASSAYGTTYGATLSFTTTGGVITPQYQPTLTVTPSSLTINQNQVATFYASYDADGPTGPQSASDVSYSANWSSSNTTVANRTGNNGSFVGVNGGTAQVTAAYAGLIASATLSVLNNTPSGTQPSAQTIPATSITDSNAVLNGSVNANGASTSYWFEYGTTYALTNHTSNQSAGSGTNAIQVNAAISGLASNTTYYFRVVAQNQFGITYGQTLSFVSTYTQQGSAPSVTTNQASGITTNGATINGLVNANGASTNYWFEYGTNSSLGSNTGSQSVGSGTFAQSVFANINNIQANTTYYFRVVAQNQYGISYGSILSFTTSGGNNNQGSAPNAQTNSASNITVSSAQLNGSVNPNGYNTSYWFEYGINTNLGQTTQFQTAGSNNSTVTANAYIYGLAANTTYYFRVVAQNQYGISYGSILNFQTGNGGGIFNGSAPYAQTNQVTGVGSNAATFNGLVSPNGSDTYSWFEYGISPSSLVYTTNSNYVGSGNGSTNVSQNVTNLIGNTTYYYRIVARNNNGTSYGSVVSFNSFGNNNNNNGNAPTVVTRPANYVYRNSALITGDVNPNGGIASGWFEYGVSTNLGLTTNQQPVGSAYSTSNIVYALSGLLPNTTYYFRAVAQNQYGVAYGQILSFRTTPYIAIEPPIYQPPVYQPPVYQPPVYIPVTGGVAQECVSVTPSTNVTSVDAGKEFILTVTYRNGCAYDIKNAILRITLPAEVQFISADNPYFVREGNTLTFNIGTIPANGQGTITIRAKVADDVESGATLIITHNLGFNDNRGNFRSVNSLLTLTVNSGRSFLASLLEFLSSLFSYCWFWILLALLILLIVLFLMYRALAPGRTTEVRRVDIMNHQ